MKYFDSLKEAYNDPEFSSHLNDRDFEYCYTRLDYGLRAKLTESLYKLNENPINHTEEILEGMVLKDVKSVKIPNNVKSIGKKAFMDCTSLKSIEIPNSVTSIGHVAFGSCKSLTYNVKDGLKYLGNKANPYLYLAGAESTSITTAIIDGNCRFIGNKAFGSCSKLTSVVIPRSVTNIGWYAFENCSSLKSVKFGDNGQLKTIGYQSFYNCSSLTNIGIPSTVKNIGSQAFYNCTSLESLTFGGTSIEWKAISKGSKWGYSVPATYVQCTNRNVKP